MKNVAQKRLIQEYYLRRAKDYDKQKARTWKCKSGFRADILNDVIKALKHLTDKQMLEVGVGSGRIGSQLLKETRLQFVGLDISREMLKLAKAKLASNKQKFNLVLADADHLPFLARTFDALVCLSTIHYFSKPERSLTELSRTLKNNGIFVYGDVAMHESDNENFLDKLEKTLSKAHERYYKPSKLKKILEKHALNVSKMSIISYRKSFIALMEDKGRYFKVKPESIEDCLKEATIDEKKLYAIDSEGMTLFYTLIVAVKEGFVA